MAQELSRRTGIPYFKNQCELMFFRDDPGYFVKAMKYGDPYFCSYLSQTGASVILDRSYPSEYVYSQIFERTTDWRMLKIVDQLYADLDAKIICPFRSDYSAVNDRFEEIDINKLNALHEMYSQFCTWTQCDVIRFNVDDQNINRQMDLIISFIVQQDIKN